jgi:serine/threonine protein kinase/WD40 repeat protein
VSEQPCPSSDELSGFFLGTLPEADLERILRHLDGCPGCAAAVRALDEAGDPVLAAMSQPTSTPDDAEAGPETEPAESSRPLPERLGDFRLLRQVGRGGMGVVYEAEQVSLGRRVALKVLPHHSLLDPEAVERFRREARAAAGLHHTNIVQVFGTGEQDGLHYFVMQFIPGLGLDVLIDELKQLRPEQQPSLSRKVSLAGTAYEVLSGHLANPRVAEPVKAPADATARLSALTGAGAESARAVVSSAGAGRGYWVSVARIGAQVADALAFAHAHGVVHRDIKPSNLLLDPRGTVWVTDFGLAKAAGDAGDLTRSGDVLGTLRYMAPERFQGRSDARSDIYSLGVTLYELLTFRSPFGVADREQLLHQVMHAEPIRPRKANPEVPRDLETVVLKAIGREPADRYQSAAGLADDLRRFVDDRPVRARRMTPPERLWRWCRRDPRTAALLGALLLTLVAGLAAVAVQWRREAAARRQAQHAEGVARASLYLSSIAQARLEWRLNNVPAAEQLLASCDAERHGWEWHYLHALNHPELFSGTIQVVTSGAAFSPDGRFLAVAGWNCFHRPDDHSPNPVVVFDLQSGAHFTLAGSANEGPFPAFSPDSRLLAVSTPTGPCQLWDVAARKPLVSWHEAGLATFSPDGKLLALGGPREITFLDVAGGAVVRRLPSAGGRVVFSPDGRLLAVSGPRGVELRETTGRQVALLAYAPGPRDPSFEEQGPATAFSPHGKRLAVATSPAQVWDVATGRLLLNLAGHSGVVAGVAFSPDGRQIATCGADHTVRLWEAHRGAERAVLRGHPGWVGCVAFHPDGWCLASGGRQPGDVRLWDLTRPPEHLTLPGAAAQALAFDPAGGRLHLVGLHGRLESRDPVSGATVEGPRIDLLDVSVPGQWVTPAAIAAYSADCRLLAGISRDRRTIKVWQVEDGREVAALTGLGGRAVHVALSPDGRRVAAIDWPPAQDPPVRAIRVWDVATGQVLCERASALAPEGVSGAVALSADGGRLAFAEDGRPAAQVRVCDAAGGHDRLTLRAGEAPLLCLAFSPDDRLLAGGDLAQHLFVWDLTTGQALHPVPLEGPFFRLAFSPDGRRLAAVDRDQVKVWDVAAGKEMLTLRGAPPRPKDEGFNPALAWSPDGRWLAAANWDESVSVWDGADAAGPVRAVPPGRVVAWHLEQAEAALGSGQPSAAAFHLGRLRDVALPDLPSRRRRGRLFLRAGAWPQAAADFAPAFAGHDPDDPALWLDYARALVLQGDADGYRRLWVRARTVAEQQGWSARDRASLGVLAPGGVEPDEGLRLAGEAAAAEPRRPDVPLLLGLAHYRAGEWGRALAPLQQSADAAPEGAWLRWPALALVHHRLGHADEARRWLGKAAEWRRQEARRIEESAGVTPDGNWPDFLILYTEADALLNGGKP